VLILPSQTPATVASIANYKREMRDAFAPMAVVVSLKEILIWVAGTCSVI
jgi:sulfate adenylyltransferase subunit 1 (EFTu-like GTPase family)